MTLIFSILSYILLSYGAFKAFEHSQAHGSKITLIMNGILFMVCMAMTFYMIKFYDVILSEPLNVWLNDAESVVKFVLALYLLSFHIPNKK